MKKTSLSLAVLALCASGLLITPVSGQVGRRFPSEKKIVTDSVTGTPLTFLTSTPAGDSKIYQTHQQWTADGKWLIFRSQRAPGQAMAVNEETGVIVQVTEKGYLGMLCNARQSMRLYVMRDVNVGSGRGRGPSVAAGTRANGAVATAAATAPASTSATAAPGGAAPDGRSGRGGLNRPRGPFQIVEIDLAKVFADSEAGAMKPASEYERVCGTTPEGMAADGNMGLDANEDFMYFRIRGDYVAQHLAPGTKIEEHFGPRGMGAGPTGLASMNLKTGEVKFVVGVGFQIGHVQTNPWVPSEIVFCWETGGKAPQRTWTVMADGTGLRPLYPEASYDWITHEAVITKDEVAIAMLAHRRPGVPETDPWGVSSTGEHPSGVGIVNLRTHQMRIVGQVPIGNPGRSVWHVQGSPDGRWAVADDFKYRLWLIDRHTGEMIVLADLGQKTTAADHIHPTFSLDSTRIEIQSAMLSENNRSLNICIVPVPKTWLHRTYSNKAPE
jgi:oligogalacturonide lyase